MKGGPFGDIKKFSKISLKKPKRGGLILSKKVRIFCFENFVKKLAHRHGFEPGPSELKSKHLTARPKKSELCDLRSETRELSRGKKKHPHFPITLACRKCNYDNLNTLRKL